MQVTIDKVYWTILIIAVVNTIKSFKIDERIANRVKRWNKWRKGNRNSKFYKFLVLIGIAKSSTYILTFIDDGFEEVRKEMQREDKK